MLRREVPEKPNVRSKYTIPQIDSKGNGYKIYREEANRWTKECELEKHKLGAVLWLDLTTDESSNVKTLMLEKVTTDELRLLRRWTRCSQRSASTTAQVKKIPVDKKQEEP